MLIDFDSFKRFELPVLTLVNPNRKELGQLGSYMNLQIDLKFNSLSEISFEYPEKEENGEKTNLYNEIQYRRLIRIESFGYFIISKCDETNDGVEKQLSISATSAEVELNYRKLNLFKGTYKFYDPLNFSETLLGKIFEKIPSWKIGYVSSELWNKYRTFDISDETTYGFLMDKAEKSYECIFLYDTFSRTVNVYSPADIVRKTDIYVSYINLIKKLDIKTDSKDIYTCMSCYGDGSLNISTVNPLGNTFVYDFSYFKPWMSEGLRQSLSKWETLFYEKQVTYQSTLLSVKLKNGELIKLQGEKTDLESAYNAKKKCKLQEFKEDIQTTLLTRHWCLRWPLWKLK